jgi:Ca-activated chloride channel homolog
LVAKVTAPDGTSSEVPLDAVGAGLYSATVAASRPGAYVASLVDEQTQTLEATTGAVLTIGDELRPTGTDRGLLRRITEQNGGKLRDTLAGIFLDRDAERFAYSSLGPWLIGITALGLLLAVSARRLTVPEFMERAWDDFQAPRKAPAPAATTPDEPPTTALGALQRLRTRKAPPTADPAPPSVPRFSRPTPAPAPAPAPPLAPRTAQPQAARSAEVAATEAASGARQPTAAEILLARRRSRKG